MPGPRIDPLWLKKLRARGSLPPTKTRVPLYIDQTEVGSVEPEFLNQVLSRIANPAELALRRTLDGSGLGWHLLGEPTAAMARLAIALRDAGLSGKWRNEQLDATDTQGRRVGSIERAAVRPLGITTHAVHLIGITSEDRVWIQQRSLDKANDPGLWDTLVGGLVASADTIETALQRETWEEAGLHLHQLRGLSPCGQITVTHPSVDGDGAGYMREHIHGFTATVPMDLEPINQDGEVARFALLSKSDLVSWLEQDRFTVEAALILIAALGLG